MAASRAASSAYRAATQKGSKENTNFPVPMAVNLARFALRTSTAGWESAPVYDTTYSLQPQPFKVEVRRGSQAAGGVTSIASANSGGPASSPITGPITTSPATEGTRFARNQEDAIAALPANSNVEEDTRAAGIGNRTLIRWLRDPEFQAAYRQVRRDAFSAVGRADAPGIRRGSIHAPESYGGWQLAGVQQGPGGGLQADHAGGEGQRSFRRSPNFDGQLAILVLGCARSAAGNLDPHLAVGS